jgi:hypothetical protein
MKKLFVILTALSFSYAGYSQTWLEQEMNGQSYGANCPPTTPDENLYSEPFDQSWRQGFTGIGIACWPQTSLQVHKNDPAAETALNTFIGSLGAAYTDFTTVFTNGGTNGQAFAASNISYTVRSGNNAGINFGVIGSANGDGMNNNMGVLGTANGDNNYEMFGVQGVAEGSGNGRTVGAYGIGIGDGQTQGNFGVWGQCNTFSDANSINVGVYGRGVWWADDEPAMVNIGVHGVAGCSTGGGGGTQFNAGVFGENIACGAVSDGGAPYPVASYAGYFNGDVFATGNYYFSDMRYKENIRPIKSALDRLSKVNMYTYTFKQGTGFSLRQGDQFGALAQELEKQFPELVRELNVMKHTNDADYKNVQSIKGVDYIGFIPLLVQSVKELNEKIETLDPEKSSAALAELKRKVADIQGALNQTTGTDEGATDFIVAYPNPSSTDMTISIKRNTACTNCVLVVSDLAGKSVKQYRVDGNSQEVTLTAKEFGSGVFQCSLVTNGKVVSGVRIAFTE